MHSNETSVISRLNYEEALRQIPLSVFLGILSIFGLTGNVLVLYIYGKIYTSSNSRVFIICLAIVDLSACAFALPLEIITVLNQYEFDAPGICRFSRFINSLTTMTSSVILVFIALDRYRKICHPIGWHISNMVAKVLCACAVLISVCFNWPLLLLYGKKTVPLPLYNLNGTECSINDEFVPTIYPLLHNLLSLGTFIAGVVVLVVLYSLIGKHVRFFAKKKESREQSSDALEEMTSSQQKQRKEKLNSLNKDLSSRMSITSVCDRNDKMSGFSNQPGQSQNGTIETNQSVSSNMNKMSQSLETFISDTTDTAGDQIRRESSDIRKTRSLFGISRIATLKIRVSRMRKERASRKDKFQPSRKKLAKSTTYLMFVISFAFVISFVPYLLLVLIREVNKQFVNDLSDAGRAAYRFFLRSYFLNCAVNPVLYSIFDMRFRKAFKSLLSNVGNKCCGGRCNVLDIKGQKETP